jgi:hypothetical protein
MGDDKAPAEQQESVAVALCEIPVGYVIEVTELLGMQPLPQVLARIKKHYPIGSHAGSFGRVGDGIKQGITNIEYVSGAIDSLWGGSKYKARPCTDEEWEAEKALWILEINAKKKGR